MLPGLGQAAQPLGDKPRNGVVVPLGQIHAGHVRHLVNGGGAVHGELRLAHPVDFLLLVVVLVLDVAHNVLHQILQGDEPGGAAVLVQHNGNLHLALGHLGEQLAALFRLRHKVGRPHQVGDFDKLRHRAAHIGQQVLDVADAHHSVDVLVVHRHAGAAVLHGGLHHLGDGVRVLHGNDVRAVGHGLPGGGVLKVQDVGNHVPLCLLDDALFLALAHHLEDFLLGDQVVQNVGVNAAQPQDAVGNGSAQL